MRSAMSRSSFFGRGRVRRIVLRAWARRCNSKVFTLVLAPPILCDMLNRSQDLDRLFRALADPARRAILERLGRGPAPVSELAKPLPMSLPAAMQHLGVLEAAGLIRTQKTGRTRTCAIEPQAISRAEQWITARRREWEGRLDRLDEYLKTLDHG